MQNYLKPLESVDYVYPWVRDLDELKSKVFSTGSRGDGPAVDEKRLTVCLSSTEKGRELLAGYWASRKAFAAQLDKWALQLKQQESERVWNLLYNQLSLEEGDFVAWNAQADPHKKPFRLRKADLWTNGTPVATIVLSGETKDGTWRTVHFKDFNTAKDALCGQVLTQGGPADLSLAQIRAELQQADDLIEQDDHLWRRHGQTYYGLMALMNPQGCLDPLGEELFYEWDKTQPLTLTMRIDSKSHLVLEGTGPSKPLSRKYQKAPWSSPHSGTVVLRLSVNGLLSPQSETVRLNARPGQLERFRDLLVYAVQGAITGYVQRVCREFRVLGPLPCIEVSLGNGVPGRTGIEVAYRSPATTSSR